MTAANVAVSPKVGRAWGNGPIMAVAMSVGLVAGIAIGALALRPATASGPAAAAITVSQTTSQPRVGPMGRTAPAVTETSLVANYVQIVSNIEAAEGRHDFAAKARFESQLSAALTAETIGVVYQQHALWSKALAEAQATGNGYEIFRATEGLNDLCGTAAAKAQLTFC